MAELSAHPGTIQMIDVHDQSSRLVPAATVPTRQQFVMLDKDGVETQDPKLATARVPIVLVRVLHLDAQGALVPPARAVQMRIMEYGPDGRLLRSTTMIKD